MPSMLKGLKSKLSKKKSKPQAAQPDFQDSLRDPLQDMNKTMSDRLVKKGGKAKKGQGYGEVLEGLRLIENPAIPMVTRLKQAPKVLKRMDEWLDEHSKDKSRRAKGVRKARQQVQEFHLAGMAGGDAELRDFIAGEGAATLGAVRAGGQQVRALKDNKNSLLEQRVARRKDNKDAGREQEDDVAKVLNRGKLDYGGVAGKLAGHMRELESAHLSKQIAKEGLSGGTSERTLGSGAVGETHLADFDGEQKVFKGDGDLPEVMSLAGADVALSSARAVASSVVNDALGSSVVGKTEFAEMDGQKGTAMPLAKGESIRKVGTVDWTGREDLQDNAPLANPRNVNEVFQSNGDVDFSDPVMQRELIELQINDIISGQIDRHAGNYHVEKGEDGNIAGVNAFDNDGAFGSDMMDWDRDIHKTDSFGEEVFHSTVEMPPVMSREQADRILDVDMGALSARLHELLPTEEVQGALLRLMDLQNHVYELEGQRRIIDAYDQESYAQIMQAGAKKSYVARDSIATTQMNALQQAFEEN